MTNFLSDYADLVRGKTYKSALCSESDGIPLLGLGAIEREGGFKSSFRRYQGDTDPRTIVESGDLFFSLKDLTQAGHLLGSVARLPESIPQGRLTQDTLKLSLSEIDPTYVYWVLRSPQARRFYKSLATGTTNLGLAREDFLSLPIPPYTAERKFTVELLERIESKIELNKKINQTLEEIAKAIFKSWFVDFDPVRAKAEGRPTGLPPEISDLFPDELADSEIGEIPTGWNVQPLSEQIRVNPKYTLKKGTDAYFVEMKCLSESTASISEGYLRGFTSGSKFKRFDTLFARITPCLENGKTGLLLNSSASEVCWGSTEFIVLSPKDDQSPLFPYCWARDENLRTAAVSSMTGSSGRQRVPNDFFDRYLVADPDSSLHRTFAKVADPIMKRIQLCEEEITTLSELRDTLLPKLISGELRIPDAEKFLEEAGF